MFQQKICLASDNWSPVHPAVMEAIFKANEHFAPSYGADSFTEEACSLIKQSLGKACKVLIIPTGTGANILALKLSCKAHESIICSDIAHINYQESGAAEAIIGCKLLTVSHTNGKICLAPLLKKIRGERAFGRHSTLPRVLSISQPTEVGTVYTIEELRSLSKLCKEEELLLHIDGSRYYNASASLKIGLDQMISEVEVDLLSLGGTKNGLMGVESLVIFNHLLELGADHLQKQTLQLPSKMRFSSAQYIPFFKNRLWLTLATNANEKAGDIASIIKMFPQLSLSYPVDTNQVFFTAPKEWIAKIQEKINCYVWDREKNEIRFITSWNTSNQDVKVVEIILTELSKPTHKTL